MVLGGVFDLYTRKLEAHEEFESTEPMQNYLKLGITLRALFCQKMSYQRVSREWANRA